MVPRRRSRRSSGWETMTPCCYRPEEDGVFTMCLADLLSTVAVLVVQLEVEEPEEDTATQGQRVDSPAAAVDQARETAELQPARVAAVLSTGQESLPPKFDLPPTSCPAMPFFKKRLPFVREFVAAGGD
ncbi:unnamed protein product [Lampetra fluviatilis]